MVNQAWCQLHPIRPSPIVHLDANHLPHLVEGMEGTAMATDLDMDVSMGTVMAMDVSMGTVMAMDTAMNTDLGMVVGMDMATSMGVAVGMGMGTGTGTGMAMDADTGTSVVTNMVIVTRKEKTVMGLQAALAAVTLTRI
ncbi:putative per-hexamer repeat protein 5 [Lampris incognitus]|uniref:putative per-hexamer repeat protein 5 n=1 Tax=Lampris incognitus TaxID=2546036 RepID=UPI0024B4D75A|nr:putative per-hexamer repeat protein 5 [Lampris incognitus]